MPLHPSIVHFPPVLLIAAAVMYALGITLQKRQLEVIGFAFHVAGLAFCILAIFTGDFESDRIAINPAIQELMRRHENVVMMSTYGFGMLGIWAFLRQKSTLKWERIAFVAVFLVLMAFLMVGAHLGGRMVYEEGAGVEPLQEQIRNQPHTPAANPEIGLKFDSK